MAKVEISEKCKKSVILEAYNKLQKKIEERKNPHPQEEQVREEEKELLTDVSDFSFETIVKELMDVKLVLNKNLEVLQEDLLAQYKKFVDLRRGVEISKKEVEQIHGVRINANSLAALIQAQKELKEECDQEIDQKRLDSEERVALQKMQWDQERDAVERERGREEEAYQYDLQLNRKKDCDVYEEKKQSLDKELEERKSVVEQVLQEKEKGLDDREKRLDDLIEQVDSFPEQLANEVARARAEASDEVQRQLRFEIEIEKKEREGEGLLSEQIITSLRTKIAEQERQIEQLVQQANAAGRQVQDIAVKAVEGAAYARTCDKQQTASAC